MKQKNEAISAEKAAKLEVAKENMDKIVENQVKTYKQK